MYMRTQQGHFVCAECLSHVQDPTVVTFDNLSTGPEVHMPCPYCGEEALVDAEWCPSCESNWMKKGEECCDKCQKSARQMLGMFARSMTVEQLRYLDNVIEGNGLEEFK